MIDQARSYGPVGKARRHNAIFRHCSTKRVSFTMEVSQPRGPRTQVDHQDHIDEPGIHRDVGEIGDPDTVRDAGLEIPIHQVSGAYSTLARDGGSGLTDPNQTIHSLIAHQPGPRCVWKLRGNRGGAATPVFYAARRGFPASGRSLKSRLLRPRNHVDDLRILEGAKDGQPCFPGQIGSALRPARLSARSSSMNW